MGQERVVRFAGEPPEWVVIRAKLAERGFAATLRMIDGLPAFPDETPEPGWKELRSRFRLRHGDPSPRSEPTDMRGLGQRRRGPVGIVDRLGRRLRRNVIHIGDGIVTSKSVANGESASRMPG